jgi:hypothetical protein
MPVWMTAPTEGVGSLARAGAVLLLVMMTSIFLPGAGDSAAPPTPSNRSLLLDCDGSAPGCFISEPSRRCLPTLTTSPGTQAWRLCSRERC